MRASLENLPVEERLLTKIEVRISELLDKLADYRLVEANLREKMDKAEVAIVACCDVFLRLPGGKGATSLRAFIPAKEIQSEKIKLQT